MYIRMAFQYTLSIFLLQHAECLYPAICLKEESHLFEYSVFIIKERGNSDSPITDNDDNNHSYKED